jgi:hypothetical protein
MRPDPREAAVIALRKTGLALWFCTFGVLWLVGWGVLHSTKWINLAAAWWCKRVAKTLEWV